MIKILHGDNVAASRISLSNLIDQAKKTSKEIVYLDGTKADLGNIRQAMEASSLFADNKLVVIENLLSGLKSARKQKIEDYLSKTDTPVSLILWEEKELSKTKLLPNADSQIFKLDQIMFRFLDSIVPNNTITLLILLRALKENEASELILFMIIRQVRLLLIAKDLGSEGLVLAPWQKSKILSQASKFDLEKLKQLYAELLEIDYSQKTGGDAFPLSSRLDLLVAGL